MTPPSKYVSINRQMFIQTGFTLKTAQFIFSAVSLANAVLLLARICDVVLWASSGQGGWLTRLERKNDVRLRTDDIWSPCGAKEGSRSLNTSSSRTPFGCKRHAALLTTYDSSIYMSSDATLERQCSVLARDTCICILDHIYTMIFSSMSLSEQVKAETSHCATHALNVLLVHITPNMLKTFNAAKSSNITLSTIESSRDLIFRIVEEFRYEYQEIRKDHKKCNDLWKETKSICDDYMQLLGGLAVPDTLACLKSLEGQLMYLESATRVVNSSEGEVFEGGARMMLEYYQKGIRSTADRIILSTNEAREAQNQLLSSIRQLREAAEGTKTNMLESIRQSMIHTWSPITAGQGAAGAATIGTTLLIDSGLVSGSMIIGGITFPPLATVAAAGCMGFLLVALATVSIKYFFTKSRKQMIDDLDRLIDGMQCVSQLNQDLSAFIAEAVNGGKRLKEEDESGQKELSLNTLRSLIQTYESITKLSSTQKMWNLVRHSAYSAHFSRSGAVEACGAHNPKVVGSKPTLTTF
ncbi:hypothetical protein PROFUN_07718 [Planoprotostelium fungivorum]|uniref:Uncharacterized protein n=1 Tax=Planoprotostelium fungivorum TaxID=1890364 RepID=A0A2P6N1C2_9EUKA|nr:hypothetical protein PROFUN_07718 [Planoprotostelium fungivorum]